MAVFVDTDQIFDSVMLSLVEFHRGDSTLHRSRDLTCWASISAMSAASLRLTPSISAHLIRASPKELDALKLVSNP